MQLSALPTSAPDLRKMFRYDELVQTTSGMAPGNVQANLAILPRELAFDFLLFCQRNPKPCPLLEVVEAGSSVPGQTAPNADLRFDVPKYRIYQYGELTDEVTDLSEFWRDDLVSFLLGCSFSFESALVKAGISLRHNERGTVVPMFITNMQTTPAGGFSGPMVVSMRPVPHDKVVRAVQVTSRFPAVPRRAGARRRPRRDRHPRRVQPGHGGAGRDQGGRGAGVLGVRRHSAGGGHEVPPAVHDHARAGVHVHN